MADFLWRTGLHGLKWGILILFTILFAHISFGFSTSVVGFCELRRARRPAREHSTESSTSLEPGADSEPESPGRAPPPPTAILFPIYNEDASRVFAGVRATLESIRRTGREDDFDIFILSDSRDPAVWVTEEVFWQRLCQELDALGHVHYRHRRQNTDKKSGNVSDFLERWGDRYRYMVVFDADSIMTGETLVELVRLMEEHPQVGLLQTASRIIRGETFFARGQQFANRLYGRIFAAGLDYWQQGEGTYWGHNAIIRIQPFKQNCALPRLPWREPLGGKILSHDFVEAALLRRAGYEVRLVHELDGTYEEVPRNLIGYAMRDRRWCQGNAQHSWLLFASDFPFANRLHFLLGILSYGSSFLWFLFLLLNTLTVIHFELSGLTLVPVSGFAVLLGLGLQGHALVLLGLTLGVLFTPKVLSVIDLLFDRHRRESFGGIGRAALSAVIETITSTALAPVLMLFHTAFIIDILCGRNAGWGKQSRAASEALSFSTAWRVHLWHSLLGVAWAGLAWTYSPIFLVWLSPVLFGMVFAAPIDWLLASSRLGDWLRRGDLLLVPEEIQVPEEVAAVARYTSALEATLSELPFASGAAAVVDPYINALHVAILRQTAASPSPSPADPFEPAPAAWSTKVQQQGIEGLSAEEWWVLLNDPEAMSSLHHAIWRAPNLPSEGPLRRKKTRLARGAN